MDPNNQQPQNNYQQPQPQPVQPQQMQPQQAPQQQPAQPQGGQKLRIDDNMLQSIGLGQLPPQEKNRLLAQIYETLELRVGMTLANQMSDAQLKQFESFIDSNDEQGALRWLESNFPNYKNVVASELEKLKNEIQANAGAIIDAVNQQQVQQPAAQPQQMQQPQQQYPQQPQQQQYPQQPQPQQYQQPQQQYQQPHDPNQPQ